MYNVPMNLFILSLLPKECAKYMIDKHVHKILLEAVQMLCTALRVLNPEKTFHKCIYRVAHKNHPVSIWCRASLENFMWTLDLIKALHKEWRFRHNHEKLHKSYIVSLFIRDNIPTNFPETGLTPFALAMPDKYKVIGDPVQSYRNYYIGDKNKFATWKRREKPEWFE
jgi:hypothetical protein